MHSGRRVQPHNHLLCDSNGNDSMQGEIQPFSLDRDTDTTSRHSMPQLLSLQIWFNNFRSVCQTYPNICEFWNHIPIQVNAKLGQSETVPLLIFNYTQTMYPVKRSSSKKSSGEMLD
jgi:hypothetical protein